MVSIRVRTIGFHVNRPASKLYIYFFRHSPLLFLLLLLLFPSSLYTIKFTIKHGVLTVIFKKPIVLAHLHSTAEGWIHVEWKQAPWKKKKSISKVFLRESQLSVLAKCAKERSLFCEVSVVKNHKTVEPFSSMPFSCLNKVQEQFCSWPTWIIEKWFYIGEQCAVVRVNKKKSCSVSAPTLFSHGGLEIGIRLIFTYKFCRLCTKT